MKKVSFTHIGNATKTEWDIINSDHLKDRKETGQYIINYLKNVGRTGKPPLQVSLLDHSLQTATRAFRDGADDETVVCALLHDIGDKIAPDNHGTVAAAILEPFISPENHWMVLHHPLFQGYHFYHHIGRNRDDRDTFQNHPAYEKTRHFCDFWDAPAFDPGYDTLPLETFEPLVRKVFEKQPTFSNTAN